MGTELLAGIPVTVQIPGTVSGSGTTLYERQDDTGTIDGVALYAFANVALSRSAGSVLETSDYTLDANSIPSGLTPVLRVSSVTDNVVELSFTGSADSHGTANNVIDASIQFNDTLFTSGTLSDNTDTYSIRFGSVGGTFFSPWRGSSYLMDHHGNFYVIGGYDPDTQTYMGEVWKNSDQGVTWIQVDSASRFPSRGLHSSFIAPNGTFYVIGGINGYGGRVHYADVWKSSDQGITWERVGFSYDD